MPKSAKYCPIREIFIVTLTLTIASTFSDPYVRNKTKQLYLVCKEPGSNTCLARPTQYKNVKYIETSRLDPRLKINCGQSDLKRNAGRRKYIKVRPFLGSRIILCRNYKMIESSEIRTRKIISRDRREASLRGRYRGQTQSQYLSLNGEGKDDGKAEALSNADTSRASVSGKSGMGQAQSQSMYEPSCDDCYGRSEPADNLKRVPYGSELPGTGNYSPGEDSRSYTPGQGATGGTHYSPGRESSDRSPYTPGIGVAGRSPYTPGQGVSHGLSYIPGQGGTGGTSYTPSQGGTGALPYTPGQRPRGSLYPSGQEGTGGPTYSPGQGATVGTTYTPGQGGTGRPTYTPGQGDTGGSIYTPGQEGTGGPTYTSGQGNTGEPTYTPGQGGTGGPKYTPGQGGTGGPTYTPGQGGTGGPTYTPGLGGTGGTSYTPVQSGTGEPTYTQGQGGTGRPTYTPGQGGTGGSTYTPGQEGTGGPTYTSGQGNTGEPTYTPGQGGTGGPKYTPGQGGTGGPTYTPGQGGTGGPTYTPGQGGTGGPTYTPGLGGTGGTSYTPGQSGTVEPTYTQGQGGTGRPTYIPGQGGTGGPIYTPGRGNTGGPSYTPGQRGTGGQIYTPEQGSTGGPTYTTGQGGTGRPIYTPEQGGTGGPTYTPGQGGTGGPTYTPGLGGTGGTSYTPGQSGTGEPTYTQGQGGTGRPTYIPGQGGTGGPTYTPGQGDTGGKTYTPDQGSTGGPTYTPGQGGTGGPSYAPGHGGTGGSAYTPGQGGTSGLPYTPVQGITGGSTFTPGQVGTTGPIYRPGQGINYAPEQGLSRTPYGSFPENGFPAYASNQGGTIIPSYDAGQGKTTIPSYGQRQDGQTQPNQGTNWPIISGSFPGPGGLNYYCCVVSPNNNPQYVTVQGDGINSHKNIEQALANKFNNPNYDTTGKLNPQEPYSYTTLDGRNALVPGQDHPNRGSYNQIGTSNENVLSNIPGDFRGNVGPGTYGLGNDYTGSEQRGKPDGMYSPNKPGNGLNNNAINSQNSMQPSRHFGPGSNQVQNPLNTPYNNFGEIPNREGNTGYISPDSRGNLNLENADPRLHGQNIPGSGTPNAFDIAKGNQGQQGSNNINQVPSGSLNRQQRPYFNPNAQERPSSGQPGSLGTNGQNVIYDSNGSPIYGQHFNTPGGNIHGTQGSQTNFGTPSQGPYKQVGSGIQYGLPNNQQGTNSFNYQGTGQPGQGMTSDFSGHPQDRDGFGGKTTNQPGGQYIGNQFGGTGTNGYNQMIPGQNTDISNIPQNVIDPNSIAGSLDDDAEAMASVSQDVNGTLASASSKGGNDKGRAQTQVQGTYTGSGSFSAQAQITDENKGAESEVSGGKKGASSSAQGRGRNNKSQAGVQLGSETGSLQTQAQSDSAAHSSNTQVQGSIKGGMADAQARGPGSTSSQAQIGFTPYKVGDKSHELIKGPFVGSGTASAQSSGRTGQSQSQLQGTFKYGISYSGASQAGSSLDKDAVFPNRLPFNKINVFDETNKNIDVNAEETITTTDLPLLPMIPVDESVTDKEETLSNSESHPLSHAHSDHHRTETQTSAPNGSSLVGNRRSFQPAFSNNGADYEYDKEDNADYDPDNVGDEQGEYNYDDFPRDPENSQTHQSLSSSKKALDIKQSNKGSTQHILLGPLNGHDAKVVQKTSEQPDEEKIYQPGERVPGTGGYTIPIGFTGSIKAVSSKDKTYAVGLPDSPSQAQSVTLTPGTGKVRYVNPQSIPNYSKNVNRNDLRSLNPKVDNGNKYVSVSKSVTGALDGDNNIKKQYSHTYYTKSSSCGYFTFTCTMVSGSNGRKKVCRPKVPTNPDGTPMRC